MRERTVLGKGFKLVNLTSGQLYFITEKDISTGEKSGFYKIGIVRESDDRNSRDRLIEHQTGNPRRLIIEKIFTMPAVEAVETTLHYLFAKNRLMGEWMRFSPEELATALYKAEELAQEIANQLPKFQTVDELAGIESNGIIKNKDAESIRLHESASRNRLVINYCANLIDKYKNILVTAIEKGVDVSSQAKKQIRKGSKKFDAKLFEARFPDIFKKYTTYIPKMNQRFLWKNLIEFSNIEDLFDAQQIQLIRDFETILDRSSSDLNVIFELHEKHLGLLEIQKYAEWQSEIATANIKVITGQDEGIDGICSWKRNVVQKIEIDKEGFERDYPELYAECLIENLPTEALIVKPNISEKL